MSAADDRVQVAAAKLRKTLDQRLGRETPAKPELSDLEKARIWQEGWDHYRTHFSPMFPEFGKNPYLKEGP